MPKIPLFRVLKGKLLEIAELQDLLVIELSKKFDFILHGGTAVWRVYGGKRFSYDVDIYYWNPEEIGAFLSKVGWARLTKRRVTESRRGYFRIEGRVPVELEVSTPPQGVEAIDEEFWLVDGTSIVVRTLRPEDLLKEKVEAFVERRKARDLYDIYYLLDLCDPKKVKEVLSGLALDAPPDDFHMLEELVLMGRAPAFETIKSKVLAYAQG